MSKVLITGTDGFIGSHLTEAMVRAGHEVRAFVLYNSFNSWGWLDQCAPDLKGKFEVFAGEDRAFAGEVSNPGVLRRRTFRVLATVGKRGRFGRPDSGQVDTRLRYFASV